MKFRIFILGNFMGLSLFLYLFRHRLRFRIFRAESFCGHGFDHLGFDGLVLVIHIDSRNLVNYVQTFCDFPEGSVSAV